MVAANARYADSFDGPLPLPPARQVAVVACMDARLDVSRALGLAEGDAHVIRNAGGVVTAGEIRSLAISQGLPGTTEIVLVHHTDCGMISPSATRSSAPRSSRRSASGRSGTRRRSPTSSTTSGPPASASWRALHPAQGARPGLRVRR